MIKKRTKPQIVFIHGGMTFRNRRGYLDYLKHVDVSPEKAPSWKGKYLDLRFGREFELIRPSMPLKENARYEDWKIYFERFFPRLKDGLILLGYSLGGMFLAKYLSENKFPKKILTTYLVCPPFDDTVLGEDLVGGFRLKSDLSLIGKNCANINLLFSEHDDIVPVSHAYKYANKIKGANIVIYENIPGHFRIPEFPEIVKMIRKDAKRK